MTKFFRDDAVIGVMMLVQPKVDCAVLSPNCSLYRANLSRRNTSSRLLQELKIEIFRLESVHYAVGIQAFGQQRRSVTDVCADVQDISSVRQ